jgi:hypothetical protein
MPSRTRQKKRFCHIENSSRVTMMAASNAKGRAAALSPAESTKRSNRAFSTTGSTALSHAAPIAKAMAPAAGRQ